MKILYANKTFENQKEFHKFLIDNKKILIAQKKAVVKHSDWCGYTYTVPVDNIEKTEKREDNDNEIYKGLVMNTTNYMDGHDDVHIDGLWNKTLKENRNLFLLQEHEMSFEKTIADSEDINAFTKIMQWKELGMNTEGFTQALIFNTKIQKENNEFMFEKYKRNKVRNHSVGMQYVKINLALNDINYKEEYETWSKYFNQIVNKENALEKGMFWAVTEAKLIEGSAVMRGSNPITPTLPEQKKQEIVKTDYSNIHEKLKKINSLIK
jgi:hypothetical protein